MTKKMKNGFCEKKKMEKIEWKRLIALLLSAFDSLSESELSADESKPFSTPEGAFIQSSRKSFHRKILKNICGIDSCVKG